ncbi:MAG: hypothetical protein PHD21_04905 [Flavobacteriales bacterium]|nr:hypothetical protein [Flavobacteriales bacterium]
MKKVVFLFCVMCTACGLSAQRLPEKALREITHRQVQEYILPKIDVVGQAEGLEKSAYATLYPQSWGRNKTVLTDGSSFINLTVLLLTAGEKKATRTTFSDINTHKEIAVSQGAKYITSTYFTTERGWKALRISMEKTKGSDIAYMDVYFVLINKSTVVTGTAAVAGADVREIERFFPQYRKIFDYMVYSIYKR